MARSMSGALLIEINKEGNDCLGAELGRVCVKANLYIAHVARALKVSRMTLHSWFRGGKIRAKNEKVIHAFIKLVREDMEKEVLPAKNLAASRTYIKSLIGDEI
jgi:hypothetical protein